MDMRLKAKSMLLLRMISSLIWHVIEGVNVPAMFVFGDSLEDAGTNHHIGNCTARGDFTPYGVSSFPSPTVFFRRVRKKSYLIYSLYCISSGGNDIEAHFSGPYSNLSDTQFVTLLVHTHGRYIQRLHRARARKFLILNISVVGCTPSARFTYNLKFHGNCVEPRNNVAHDYNIALKKLVDHLK
ncbi:GDSL esterase/lipase At1g58525-like [Cryptomeria japonica]|uniref:GDSL esterase/lipase At1g58525-like n=1 Tax=Cryptomeria japonica TaxID=3369 RepID=UPI0025AD41B1|nr:GDSL esterase/lipase At1g58525-like [Cryptomeria japonica]